MHIKNTWVEGRYHISMPAPAESMWKQHLVQVVEFILLTAVAGMALFALVS